MGCFERSRLPSPAGLHRAFFLPGVTEGFFFFFIIMKTYKIIKEGVANPIVFGLCHEYVKEHHPEVTVTYLAFAKAKKGVRKAVIAALETTTY